MNQELIQAFEEDTLVFDAEKFNALSYDDQLEFILRKASFIRKHILRDDCNVSLSESVGVYTH